MNESDVRRVLSEKKEGYNVEAGGILHDVKYDLECSGVTKVRVINRYDVSGITDEEYEKAKTVVFSEPPVDTVSDETVDLSDADYVLIIESLPGQYDQRADSAAQCIQFLTQKERPLVKCARIVAFYGNVSEEDKAKIKGYLINPVEAREASAEKPATLVDKYDIPTTVPSIDGFTSMDDEALKALRSSMGLAMSFEDIKFVQDFFKTQGRQPTVTEIRVLDTYWSDHCRHTTFLTQLTDVKFDGDDELTEEIKKTYADYLSNREEVYGERISKKPTCLMDLATLAAKKLKKDGKLADLDESEEINACSIKVKIEVDGKEEDYIFMFKNETHNHPTEIEPFGGAATCLGGAIRDPLSGRSYVYQAMRVTGAGDPTVPVSLTLKGKLSQKKLVRTAAAGYSSYGNQIGLATGQVDELYHPGYVAKRMEIGAVVGAAPAYNIVRERPSAGDIVVLLGGRTGRDGIGGATGSSKAHDTKSVITCGSEVQKGNAPTERKLQRLFRYPEVTRLIIRCNDFGAGGVSVAIGELAAGLKINLDAVPKKYEGLDGTEIAISESQERMAVVVHPSDLDKFMAAAEKENLEATVVAEVTEEPSMKMVWNGNTIVDLPRSFIDTNGASQFTEVVVKPAEGEQYLDKTADGVVDGDFAASLKGTLNSLDGCSRKGLIQRFDSSIGAATVLMPYGGKMQDSPEEGMAAKIPLDKGYTKDCSVMAYGFDPFYTEWSPFAGSYHAVVESLLKLLAMGCDPSKARLTFQEYFERMGEPSTWGKPLSALLGAYRAQLDYGTAAIGGKDSMSGTFNDIHVPPTLVSFAVGMSKADKVISATLKGAGQKLYMLSCARNGMGFYKKDHVLRVFKSVRELEERGQVKNAAVVKSAGLASRVAAMCFGNELGFEFSDKLTFSDLFSRKMGTIVVAIPNDSNAVDKVEMAGGKYVGQTNDSGKFTWNGASLDLADALEAYEGKLERIFPTKAADAEMPLEIKEFTTDKTFKAAPGVLKGAKPKVVIPVFPGTNCEIDTARAFERAGAEAEVFVIRNRNQNDINESFRDLAKKINQANIVMIPGGFSAGDEPEGSGKFITASFRNSALADAVSDLLKNRDGLMLGICNGFQALIKLGLVPFGEIKDLTSDSPTLTFNNIGRHQNKYVATKIMSNNSPWLAGVKPGEVYEIPVSHGEGKIACSTELVEKLARNGQIATCYVDLNGNAAKDTQFNPNGSICAIEGILSPDGRVFGKMGHSERYDIDLCSNIPGPKDQKIFESGVAYFL
ncbi:MAG: phosphoribosylformylglycinamidine synthase [Ruminococcaceae bacterium]|nr:phosphoribosylformylglycinamidine synthase [Oscillospiraceae bacterium]